MFDTIASLPRLLPIWVSITSNIAVFNGRGGAGLIGRCVIVLSLVMTTTDRKDMSVVLVFGEEYRHRVNLRLILNNFNSLSCEQEIWAKAHETRDSINLISHAGCFGLSPVISAQFTLEM